MANPARSRLLADVSLWSADLVNLAQEVRRLEPFADSFHIDVCDARFAPGLLFFPDLVRALRPLTRRPFHVHLMAERPTSLIPDFLAAGADRITVHEEVGAVELESALEAIRRAGRAAGLALLLETPVAAARPYLERIDSLLLLGTRPGIKGQDLAPEAPARMAAAAALLGGRRTQARLIADGGIRADTAPLLRRAGADAVVPGSLVFGSPNPAETFAWLHAL